MTSLLVPRRRRDVEVLDDPRVEAGIRARSLDDVGRANRLFGGTRAVLAELARALGASKVDEATLLDVGTGLGDIPRHAVSMARGPRGRAATARRGSRRVPRPLGERVRPARALR